MNNLYNIYPQKNSTNFNELMNNQNPNNKNDEIFNVNNQQKLPKGSINSSRNKTIYSNDVSDLNLQFNNNINNFRNNSNNYLKNNDNFSNQKIYSAKNNINKSLYNNSNNNFIHPLNNNMNNRTYSSNFSNTNSFQSNTLNNNFNSSRKEFFQNNLNNNFSNQYKNNFIKNNNSDFYSLDNKNRSKHLNDTKQSVLPFYEIQNKNKNFYNRNQNNDYQNNDYQNNLDRNNSDFHFNRNINQEKLNQENDKMSNVNFYNQNIPISRNFNNNEYNPPSINYSQYTNVSANPKFSELTDNYENKNILNIKKLRNNQNKDIKDFLVEKFLFIAKDLVDKNLIEEKYFPKLKQMILFENEEISNIFKIYNQEIIDLKTLINGINKILSWTLDKSRRPDSPKLLNKEKLVELIDSLNESIFDDPADHLLLHNLAIYDNEFINAAYEVYMSDFDLENFIDSIKRLINKYNRPIINNLTKNIEFNNNLINLQGQQEEFQRNENNYEKDITCEHEQGKNDKFKSNINEQDNIPNNLSQQQFYNNKEISVNVKRLNNEKDLIYKINPNKNHDNQKIQNSKNMKNLNNTSLNNVISQNLDHINNNLDSDKNNNNYELNKIKNIPLLDEKLKINNNLNFKIETYGDINNENGNNLHENKKTISEKINANKNQISIESSNNSKNVSNLNLNSNSYKTKNLNDNNDFSEKNSSSYGKDKNKIKKNIEITPYQMNERNQTNSNLHTKIPLNCKNLNSNFSIDKNLEKEILKNLHTEQKVIFKYAIRNKLPEVNIFAQLHSTIENKDILLRAIKAFCKQFINDKILKFYNNNLVNLFNSLITSRNQNLLNIFKDFNRHSSVEKLEGEISAFLNIHYLDEQNKKTKENEKNKERHNRSLSSCDSDANLINQEDSEYLKKDSQNKYNPASDEYENTDDNDNNNKDKNYKIKEFMKLINTSNFLNMEEKEIFENVISEKNNEALEIYDTYLRTGNILSIKTLVKALVKKYNSKNSIRKNSKENRNNFNNHQTQLTDEKSSGEILSKLEKIKKKHNIENIKIIKNYNYTNNNNNEYTERNKNDDEEEDNIIINDSDCLKLNKNTKIINKLDFSNNKSNPKNTNKKNKIINYDESEKDESFEDLTNKNKQYSSLDDLLKDLEKLGKISFHQYKYIIQRYINKDEILLSAWEVYTFNHFLPDLIESLKIFSINVRRTSNVITNGKTPIALAKSKNDIIEFLKSKENIEKEEIKKKQLHIIEILAKEKMLDEKTAPTIYQMIYEENHFLISAFEIFSVTKDHWEFCETLDVFCDYLKRNNKSSSSLDKINPVENKDSKLAILFENFMKNNDVFSEKEIEILKKKLLTKEEFFMSSLEFFEMNQDQNEFLDSLQFCIKD